MELEKFFKLNIEEPKKFIEHFLHIETTAERVRTLAGENISPIRGEVYPFQFSEEQNIFYNVFQRQRKEKKPVRIIILKSRQTCCSTLWLSLCFTQALFRPNTKALIVTNLDDIKLTFYKKIELFLRDLPEEIKPEITQSVLKGFHIKGFPIGNRIIPIQSELRFGVSANKDIGAGASRNWFLGSEVARWFFPEEIMLSIMPSIPNEKKTVVVLESTARGCGNYFHRLWLQAKEKKIEFEPIFIPWFEHKYYQKELDENWYDIPLDSVEEYRPEKELKKKYNLSDKQLYWRRYAIDNICGGDSLKFAQEYPSNDTECFISDDLNVFNIRKLQELRLLCEKGEKGDIRENRFISTYDGYWTIWEKPQIGVNYIFGIDSGTGIIDGNPNAIIVLRADTLDQVAEFNSHTDATQYVLDIIAGAEYYNNAFLVPELTGESGGAVLERLKEKYHNIYLWEKIDEFGKVITNKLGFVTNHFTKNLLINDIRDYINLDLGRIRSENLINELMTYIELESGRMTGLRGCNDDRVMALGLALRGYRSHQRRWENIIKMPTKKIEEYNYNVEKQLLEIPYKRNYYNKLEEENFTPYGVY